MNRRIAVLLLAWLSLAPAYAAAPSSTSSNYEVEVLIFETQLPELEGGELWTPATRPADATTANPESLSPTPDFATAMNSLRSTGRYRVLLHKRWVQTAEAKSGGPTIQLATENSELNGTLKFYLSRFLHVELNLLYQPRAGAIGGAPAPAADNTPVYTINEQRRVKSNEMNYFDHPKFGALVRVTPASG